MKNFQERLSEKMKEKKISGQKLSEMLNKSGRGTVSAWTQGKAKPNADDLALLAEILEVSIDWLMTGVKSYEKPEGTVNIVLEEYIEFLNFKNQKLEKENTSLKNNNYAAV